VKIANWNLDRPVKPSKRRREAFAHWMSEVDADVWVLTETCDDIAPGENYHAHSTRGADREGDSHERWVTIWSRYPLETLETSDPVRTVAARVRHPDEPFVVFGTVLPWLGSSWRDVPAEQGESFRAALALQLDDWKQLRSRFPREALFVLGDFNQDLAHSHYYGSRLNKEYLKRALVEAGLTALTAAYDDPVRQRSADCACIDHICLSEGARWQPVHTICWPFGPKPEKWLTDHFGVAVECTY